MLCWTLGITEHHYAVDNVLALINLALLTGHVGRWGSGINPLRGQNNVQGGGDMGALPDRLPGFQHVENDEVRQKFEQKPGARRSRRSAGLAPVGDVRRDGARRAEVVYVIGENPIQSEADQHRAARLIGMLDFLIVQDLFLTDTAELADVVFPAAAGAFESEGTVTSSERRVQRCRRTLDPPGEAREDLAIIFDLARTLGHDWGPPTPKRCGTSCARCRPVHAGMSYARLDEHRGLRWPCYDDTHPGEAFLHSRLWERPVKGPRAPFHPVEHQEPADPLSAEYPIRLTTGRRLAEYNTGVQTGAYASPTRRGETLDLSPEDAAATASSRGNWCASSRAVARSRCPPTSTTRCARGWPS
jgi:predicted molibdopterin-dependent oxidoreductase YjgC